ncbi:MAG: TetR/AcrR family transcriptional regulator [Dermatophilaceae bacterium]
MTTTPERLLSATAGLLAERGASRVSLRDITEAAGANVAAVGYHFGSKDALVSRVIRESLEATTRDRREAVMALAEDASLPDLVRAWVGHGLGPPDRDEHLPWRVVEQQLADPDPAVRAVFDAAVAQVDGLLTARLRRHLPDLSDAELRVRQLAVVGMLGGTTALLRRRIGMDLDSTVRDGLLAFIVGGLEAPPAIGRAQTATRRR